MWRNLSDSDESGEEKNCQLMFGRKKKKKRLSTDVGKKKLSEEEKIVRRRKYCQLMFGSFLVPSSTVVADESQERTKTSLTNLLESPKETT